MDTDKLIEFLDKLGNRIQGPAEHVWQIAVRQQVISSSISLAFNLIFLIIVIVVWIVSFRALNRFYGGPPKHDDDNPEFYRFAFKTFVSAIGVIVLMGLTANLQRDIIVLLNPEYNALTDLISRIR